MRARRKHEEFFSKTKTLFSIHNMAYHGAFDPIDLWWLDFSHYADDFMLSGAASALKAGLVAADALSTVSPRYAREIQTPEQGYGLDWLMRARSDRLAGITNGVDYEVWNPKNDPDRCSFVFVLCARCCTRGRCCKRNGYYSRVIDSAASEALV